MRTFLLTLSLLILAAAPLALAEDGRVGPDRSETANGRLLKPAGRLTTVGNFPTGGALTPGGQFFWAIDSGQGHDDATVVNVATGQVVQVLPLPGAYGAVAFSQDGRRAYVSGESKGGDTPTGPTKGDAGDVIHVFDVEPGSGTATERDPIAVPATAGGSGQVNSLPPPTSPKGWPEGIAVTPDGKTLVVALNQADKAAVIDVASGSGTLVGVGKYPFGAAIGKDGKTAYVSNELDGSVSVLDISARKVTATIKGLGGQLGDANSHPEGMVVDPGRDRLYVAVTNRDLVASVDTKTNTVTRMISVARPEALGAQPVALALTPDGQSLLVADAGEDALAVIALADRTHSLRVAKAPSLKAIRRGRAKVRFVRACGGPTAQQVRRYIRAARRARSATRVRRARARLPKRVACRASAANELVGRIPTAAYPTGVAVTPDGKRLVWVAAKGLGAGANPLYSFYGTSPYGQYVPQRLLGRVGVLEMPKDFKVRAFADPAPPANATAPPAGTPLRPGGPIKHVFYIVRENRTYDQIFGSEPRGDGDPSLQLFDDNGAPKPTGGVTPNAHALARSYPLLDHFYADSEVSVDGHVITSGGVANDYVQRALEANYSGRGRAFDFGIFPVTFGPNAFVFDQATRQGISFRDYGEQGAGTTPMSNDGRPTYGNVMANVDQAYPGNIQIGCVVRRTPGVPIEQANVQCTHDSATVGGTGEFAVGRAGIFADQLAVQDAQGAVPAFNYLILPNDHTNGSLAGGFTPKALIADNDLGLGQIVDAISHSSIWSSSAIIVVEDDSQDGADHVDAHRQPAFVISPWAKTGGAVVQTRYDQYSALRTAEMLLGLKPLNLNDALATPMYDAFRTDGQPDTKPYSAIVPQQSLTETNPDSGSQAQLSSRLPLNAMDSVPQAVLDQLLWRSVHGEHSTPPAPGPNASPIEHARAVRAWELLDAGKVVPAVGGDG